MRFLPQLNSISSALCTFFKHLKRIIIYLRQTATSLPNCPARRLSIGANCLTHCAKTFIQIQNKKDPLKNFNGP